MWKPWTRPALGGALAGLALFVGTSSRSYAQLPDNPPPIMPLMPLPGLPLPGSPVPPEPTYPLPAAPATYQPPAPAVPSQPAQPNYLPGPAGTPPVEGSAPPTGAANPLPGMFATVDPPRAGTFMPAPAPQTVAQSSWDLSWQNGLFFKTTDGKFSFHTGATLQYDTAFYSASPRLTLGTGGVGRFNDGTNLRRGRFFFEGTLYDAVDYKFEMEFFNGVGFSPATTTGAVNNTSVVNSPGPTDAWINIKDVPLVGNIRIGSQKEWFSLEHLNSYRYLEFMERSYLFDFAQATAFNNGFSPGVSMFRTWLNDRVFTAAGVYKNESDLIGFGVNDGNYAFTGRVAALPIWMPDDKIFWHVGGAMSHRDPVNGQVQIRLRDDIRNAPFPLLNVIANTGLINASSQNLFNLETAAVWGPLTIQAEYTANVVNNAYVTPGKPLGDLNFGAYYAEAMLFLTGESRTWNVKNAFFNRVNVLHPLRLKPTDCDGYGWGAWELAARYTYVDLSNKTIQSGRLDAVTLGLNWYLNNNAKLQFNYDYTQRGDTNNVAQGHIHAFGTRMSLDF